MSKILEMRGVCRSIKLMTRRSFSAAASEKESQKTRKMSGWQIHSYGSINDLTISSNVRLPMISRPSEVLIKVETSSVNPIDVAMAGGYGSTALNLLRRNDIEFPLTLGRDFCGTIVHKGLSVPDRYRVGDVVMGVIPVHHQGCHAEYAITDSSCIGHKPEPLSDLEAGSLLYAGMTAWSGLYTTGYLGGLPSCLPKLGRVGAGHEKKVLVLGGSGGVGHLAIQILKAEGYTVFSTASGDAVPILESLKVDKIFDYRSEQYVGDVVQSGPYDLILDCAGKGPDHANELPWKYSNYVTFSSPVLKNFDKYGLIPGLLVNTQSVVESNLKSLASQKGCVKWAYFLPLPNGIEYLTKLAAESKIRPIIQKTFEFDQINEAYSTVSEGHLRGKIGLKF